MKFLKITVFLLFVSGFNNALDAQLNPVKYFDYNLLKDKVLYIPKYQPDSRIAKKYLKKGKFSELKSLEEKVAYYNKIWNEAMAQSSYDATAYEIRGFDPKKLIKEKNKEAILLYNFVDQYSNEIAQLIVTGPKKQLIAQTIINGLDLSDPDDIKLMMNMLNFSLNETAEIDAENGSKSYSGLRNKYKENFVEFYDNIANMTFLVQKFESDNEKKDKKKNAELEEALESWTLCKYELLTEKEIQERRLDGDDKSFYWKNFNYYTKSAMMTYRFSYLLTTERDEALAFFYYLGSQKLKPSVLNKIQNKITKKGERFKKQLSN